MRRYETVFILRPGKSEEEINAIVDMTKKIILDENGSIISLNRWGLKKLAYTIKKENQGQYIFCDFAGTPAAVTEIERKFRIDDAVLKYLTIKTAEAISAEEIEKAIADAEARTAAFAGEASEGDDHAAAAEEEDIAEETTDEE